MARTVLFYKTLLQSSEQSKSVWGSDLSHSGTQTDSSFERCRIFLFGVASCVHLEDAAVLSTTVVVGYEYVWACRSNSLFCDYSQCGLPWFQGKVSPIPPISGASLRDFLGSLMLSIVGGTKPLPVSLTAPSPLSSPFFSSSCFLSLLTMFLHSHQLSSI